VETKDASQTKEKAKHGPEQIGSNVIDRKRRLPHTPNLSRRTIEPKLGAFVKFNA